MERLLWVCFGGALGSGARYLTSLVAARWFGAGFGWGTVFVNVTGSFLLGLIVAVAKARGLMGSTLYFALASGVMGGFTTYSSFNNETVTYVENGLLGRAAWNIGATVVLCLGAGFFGLRAGNWVGATR
ncbi:MAG: CrcB family protein [Polyangiaceae bacterium]|nr:CrcB family protein [Polyangiaceae bacterium]